MSISCKLWATLFALLLLLVAFTYNLSRADSNPETTYGLQTLENSFRVRLTNGPRQLCLFTNVGYGYRPFIPEGGGLALTCRDMDPADSPWKFCKGVRDTLTCLQPGVDPKDLIGI